MLRSVPPEISKLAHEIKRYAKGGRAVLIGGSVIDLLQGREPKDWDIEVYGYDYGRLEQTMRNLGYRPKTVGRAFGIIVVRAGKHDVDLSIPRKESKIGVGHKGFKVSFPKMSVKEAARRRDFTINTMGVDLNTGKLLDPFNGMKDLRAGVLRATDPKTFVEDPLRALRAMQLLSRKARSIDPATMKLIRQLAPTYPQLAKERVFEEFNKLLLKGKKPSTGLEFLRRSGWLRWFPGLAAQIGTPQRHEWHSEGSVWNHMLLTVNQAARIRHCIPEEHRLAYMYGAMLHDIGKPSTTILSKDPPEMWLTAHGHDIAGMDPAESFMRRLTSDKKLIAKVRALVGFHMQPYNLDQGGAGLPAYLRLAKKLEAAGANMELIARISQADGAGSLKVGHPYKYLDPKTCAPSWPHSPSRKIMEAQAEIERSGRLKGPVVQGRDLIALGYKPGLHFGKALKAAFQAQLDHPEWDKEQLMDVALAQMGDAARRNSELRPPPRFLEEVHAFTKAAYNKAYNKRGGASGRLPWKRIKVDLTDWPYLKRLGLTARQAERKLPDYLKKVQVGFTRSSGGKFSQPRSFMAPFVKITIGIGFGQREAKSTVEHEVRHYTQQILSVLADAPAGLPAGGVVKEAIPDEKVWQEEVDAGRFHGLDPYQRQRKRAQHFGLTQQQTHLHTRAQFAHPRDPVEFYTNLNDEVEALRRYTLQKCVQWPRLGPPTLASVQRCFNHTFKETVELGHRFKALRTKFPDRYTKMVGEVYAQAWARLLASPASLVDSDTEGTIAELLGKKGKVPLAKAKPKAKLRPKKPKWKARAKPKPRPVKPKPKLVKQKAKPKPRPRSSLGPAPVGKKAWRAEYRAEHGSQWWKDPVLKDCFSRKVRAKNCR